MWRNQKGAALLQVLLVTVVLAGMAAMLLRSSLARTTTARKTRRKVVSQMLINACQAEVNALWSVKSSEVFARDLQGCWMWCSVPLTCDEGDAACEALRNTGCDGEAEPPTASRSYTCAVRVIDGAAYRVTAQFDNSYGISAQQQCPLRYTVESGTVNEGNFTADTDTIL